jgi:hypothetical protein
MVYTNFPNNYSGTDQGIYLDGANTLASQAHTTAKNPVGLVTRQNNKLYRYVYFVTTVAGTAAASVANGAVYWAATFDPANGLYTVTSDYDTSGKVFAGLALASGITTGSYIWIQCGGYNSAMVVSSGGVGNRMVGAADSTLTKLTNSASNYETNLVVGVITVPSTTSAGFIIPSMAR